MSKGTDKHEQTKDEIARPPAPPTPAVPPADDLAVLAPAPVSSTNWLALGLRLAGGILSLMALFALLGSYHEAFFKDQQTVFQQIAVGIDACVWLLGLIAGVLIVDRMFARL